MIFDALNSLSAPELVARFGLLPISARLLVARRPLRNEADLTFLARLAPSDLARLRAFVGEPPPRAQPSDSPYVALVRGLGWSASLDAVFACHEEVALDREAKVGAALDRFAAAGVGRTTAERFHALPPLAKRRIALSPVIGERLFDGPADDFVTLRDAVYVESCVDRSEIPTLDRWSVTRDRMLVAGLPVPVPPAGPLLRYSPPERGVPWLAPRLDTELVLDLLGMSPPPTAAEGQALVDLFASSLREVDAMSEHAGALVRRVSRTWVVQRGAAWSAESEECWLGRAIWVEPMRRSETGGLAGGLLHEALHSLIYCIEAKHPLFRGGGKRPLGRARSGWSGRSLHLHAWVHACFVWYALVHHYERALERGVGAERQAAALLEEARRGFRGEEARATWRSVRPLLSEGVAAALDEVWGREEGLSAQAPRPPPVVESSSG
jgi:hypothetical protein